MMSNEIKVHPFKINGCTVVSEKKVYHFEIELNEKKFFYIVETVKVSDVELEIVLSIHRGATYWDCQLKLTNSEKKAVKKLIKSHFTKEV